MQSLVISLIALTYSLGYVTQALAETYIIGDKPGSRFDATRALLQDPKAFVLRCSEVELTERVTLKNKPRSSSRAQTK